MRVLIWNVHGSWTDAFVQGGHEYFFPWSAAGGEFWRGTENRGWPPNAVQATADELCDAEIDIVVLQRLEELELTEQLLGRRPGIDLPAVFVEHNTPAGAVPTTVHPLAEHPRIVIVHVTHFNHLAWDTGRAATTVIEHGIADPGYHYSGKLPRMAAVINEAKRRGRVTGTDLLPTFAAAGPIDLFGIDGDLAVASLDAPQGAISFGGNWAPHELHPLLAQRRLYLHAARWTSLGLSLIEAMQLGMPVVALATTEAPNAVPPQAGAISTDVQLLVLEASRLLSDPDEARKRGKVAREFAIERYGLQRFLAAWDALLGDLTPR